MKIAVIAKTRLPIAQPFRGGLEAFTHTICTEYIRRGHEVTLYAHKDSDPALNTVGFYGTEHRDADEFEIYENDEYLSIIRHIEQGSYDVVHNNSTHELPILWGMKAPLPVVTTLHTPLISKLKVALLLASGSDNLSFVTISEYFARIWQPYLHNGSHVIHNGVDLEKWPLSRTSSDYLLWYGRIVSAKGLDIALDAAHEVALPLRFAGSIDDETYYNEQIQPRLTEHDTYLGHLSQPELLAEMRGAAALVNGTRWDEPFGLTNIEAMAAGVPVAGFDRGAFREIVNEESGAVADKPNVPALAQAIRSATQLKSDAVRRQAGRFSLDIMVDRYLQLFEELR